MSNEVPPAENPAEQAFIGFRCPIDLHEKAQRRIAGNYNSFSEYLRDLVRRDLEKVQADPA